MCSSDELIHDERQVDLEEAIKMNETPMYLVPGRITNELGDRFRGAEEAAGGWAHDDNEMISVAIRAIGTPIPPCADVETVGWVDPDILAIVRKDKGLSGMTLANMKATSRTIPLVRRTDMEAQVARVVAEKDAEIARLSDALKRMTEIATIRASVQTVETVVSERTSVLRDAIVNAACDLADGVYASTVCRNLRASLNEGSAA